MTSAVSRNVTLFVAKFTLDSSVLFSRGIAFFCGLNTAADSLLLRLKPEIIQWKMKMWENKWIEEVEVLENYKIYHFFSLYYFYDLLTLKLWGFYQW